MKMRAALPSENHVIGEVACKTPSSYLVRFSQPARSISGWLAFSVSALLANDSTSGKTHQA
jgi:hypothetical protein